MKRLNNLLTILSISKQRFILLCCLITILIFSTYSRTLQAVSPTPPSRTEVCAVVKSMPQAEDTDNFLNLLKTDRSQVIKDLITLKSNMEQYNAEGYGWQNAINSPSGLEPHPDAWLIGALKIACE